MKIFRASIFLVLFFISFSNTNAEDILDKAIEKVLTNDYKLKSLEYQEKAKEYQIKQAKSGYKPQVNISSYLGWQRYKTYYSGEESQTLKYFYIALRQPIYKPDVSKRVKQSRYYKEMVSLKKEQEKQYIKYIFLTVYFDYISYREKLEIQKSIYSLYKRRYILLSKLYKYKRTTKNVLLSAESDYQNSYIDLKNIQIDIETARKALYLMLGDERFVELLSIYKFNNNLEELDLNYDYEKWKKLLKNNYEIREAITNIKIAKEEINIRKYQRYPKVDLEVSYRYSSTSAVSVASDDKRIALVMDFPIYQGGYVKNYVLEAKELKKAAQMDLRSLEQEKQLNLKDYWQELIKARKNIILLRKQLKTEQKLLRVVKLGKEKGVFTELDLINQKIRLLNVRKRLLDEANKLSLAYIKLLYITSSLDDKGLEELKRFVKIKQK